MSVYLAHDSAVGKAIRKIDNEARYGSRCDFFCRPTDWQDAVVPLKHAILLLPPPLTPFQPDLASGADDQLALHFELKMSKYPHLFKTKGG